MGPLCRVELRDFFTTSAMPYTIYLRMFSCVEIMGAGLERGKGNWVGAETRREAHASTALLVRNKIMFPWIYHDTTTLLRKDKNLWTQATRGGHSAKK